MTTSTPFDFETDLLTCSGLSIEHADGLTECEFRNCALPHELHLNVAGCGEFDLACSCSPDEHPAPAWLIAA